MTEKSEKTLNSTVNLATLLAKLRQSKGLTLREVEEATEHEVSNAYLSQLEHERIKQPSPHVLYSLSKVYGVKYDSLMETAGYVPSVAEKAMQKESRKGFAIEELTREEEKELRKYLEFIRSKK
jgi:transcriptional regulator with XRE-family HTH domain